MAKFERTFTVDTRFIDSAGEDRVWYEGEFQLDGETHYLSDEDGPTCALLNLIWAQLPGANEAPAELEQELSEALDQIDRGQGAVTVRCVDGVWTVMGAETNTVEEHLYKLAVQLRTGEIGLEVYSATVKAELAKAGW